MKLPLLSQLAQLVLGLALGAALGLAFDVLRVPRRHVRGVVFRALLDGAFCLLTFGSVFLFGMTAGDGQVRLFLFAAIAAGWTCYFLWLSGHISRRWSNLAVCARENCAGSRLREENSEKKFVFLQKNTSNLAADVLE